MADNGRELFLIDGNSLAYRAFFALPETIATSRGVPTNAIFGFASMLVKVLTEYGVNPTLVCWDAGMSGREIAYEEYKADRRKRPDLLQEQWPHLHPLVEAFGYQNVRVEGYEADDVMATLSLQAREKKIPVMMVTGDRDMFQLIEPGVRVMATARGITETKIYDTQAVIDRYGIPPELIPDFYGLKGDTSDNIPGVPGIGDKTAAQLLQEFGTLEEVLANIDKVSGAKRKENLANHADDARVSKQLATAVRDVPVDIDLEQVAAQEPDRSTLREYFREFELRDPLRRLEEALGGEEEAAPRQRGIVELEAKAVQIPAVDLGVVKGEHATLAAERELNEEGVPHGPLRFAAYAGGDEVSVGEAETLAALTLAWGERALVAHDWKSLASGEGPCDTPPLEHDTMVAAYLIDPARRKYPLPELLEDEGISALIEGSADGAAGLAERAVCTRALAERQLERIEEQGLTRLLNEVEMPLVEVLIDMERAGVKLDTERLAAINSGFADRIATLEQEIWALAGEEFTIGSPQQLGVVLFDKLGLTKKRRGKTGYSTDARVLAAIRDEHEIIGKVEQWRELTKLKSTYLDALPELISDEDGRLHTTFNQTATTTGRLSSTNPNLQNIPIRSEEGREIRACFVAEPGAKLISADYSQIELRVLAKVADEQVLKDIFERGEDVHAATAGEMFGLPPEQVDHGTRSKAKMINFGIVYGLSAYGLADRLNIPQEEAAEFIERYLARFPKVQEFITRTITEATDQGYVTTLFGRMRRIPELRARQRQTRQLGERLAVNTVIQGTAADIIKVAMVRCWKSLRAAGLSTRLVLQIHDELLFEAPESEVEQASKIIHDEMVRAYELEPPLGVDVGVGANWLEAK
ncbi:MAG TPA: DNA polymerase I [Thermoleophilaceae bacterium]